MVYVALATALLLKPLAAAIAFTVCVALTLMGAEYTAEDVVGVVPLVV
jgi:hypothetical protein